MPPNSHEAIDNSLVTETSTNKTVLKMAKKFWWGVNHLK